MKRIHSTKRQSSNAPGYVILILAVAAVGGVVYHSTRPDPCRSNVPHFISAVEPLTIAWPEAYALAESTPKIGLPSAIGRLRDLRERTTKEVPAVECLAPIRDDMLEGMDRGIASLVLFASSGDMDEVSAAGKISAVAWRTAMMKLVELKAGTIPDLSDASVQSIVSN